MTAQPELLPAPAAPPATSNRRRPATFSGCCDVTTCPLPPLLGPELTGAACKSLAPMFDDHTDPQEPAEVRDERHRQAIDICRRDCPVRAECLAARLTDSSLGDGIYGGQLFTRSRTAGRKCPCGTPLPPDAPPYRKHCTPACGDRLRPRKRPKAVTRTVTCECGTTFTTKHKHHKFCTGTCRRRHWADLGTAGRHEHRKPPPARIHMTCQRSGCGQPLTLTRRYRGSPWCSEKCRRAGVRAQAARREAA